MSSSGRDPSGGISRLYWAPPTLIGPVRVEALDALLTVSVLAESWVSVPLMVIRPEIVVAPDPPTVRDWEPPFTAPEMVSVPASELIRVAEPRVTAPLQVFVPERFRSAPLFATPVPLSVNPVGDVPSKNGPNAEVGVAATCTPLTGTPARVTVAMIVPVPVVSVSAMPFAAAI